MKKKLCLIAVTLCVTMVCGDSLADVSVPFLDRLFQAVENAKPLEANEFDITDSIWNRKVTMRKMPVPASAFAQGGELFGGMTGDGRKLLIINGVAPHLWDIATGVRTWLYPADAAAEETMRLRCAPELTLRKATPEQIEQAYERYGGRDGFAALSGRKLLEVYLTALGNGLLIGPRTDQTLISMDDRYMLLFDQSGCYWLTDTQTGAMYFCDGMPGGVLNGEVLLYELASSEVRIWNPETGRTRTISFANACQLRSGSDAFLYAAAFLADGSVCAVLRDSAISMDNGQECVAAIRTPSGTTEKYPLGTLRLSTEPSVAYSVDEKAVVLFSRTLATGTHPYLIDRRTGAVSVIASTAGALKLVPLERCAFPRGRISLPEDFSQAGSVMPFDRIDDTLLVYNLMDSRFMLLRPDTGESRYLFSDPELIFPLAYGAFATNHHDRVLAVNISYYAETYLMELK